MSIRVVKVSREWGNAWREMLHGAKVFQTPMHGHDLVVTAELKGVRIGDPEIWNLGKVTMVEFEDGSGRNFNVATQFSDGSIFVRLHSEVAVPYS